MKKKIEDYTKYDMGDFVIVAGEMDKAISGSGKVTWEETLFRSPVLGRVVGLTRRYSGQRTSCRGYCGRFDYSAADPNYLDVAAEHIFYQVKLGWLNKTILVSSSSIRLAEMEEIQELPLLFSHRIPWSRQDKQNLRYEICEAPRDSQGKFTKV